MPSLLPEDLPVGSTQVAANYRKTGFGSKFGTRELVSALVTVDGVDLTDFQTTNNDHYGTVMAPAIHNGVVNGNFSKAIQAIQTQGEIYAIGEPTYGGSVSEFTVILSADTLSDNNFQNAELVNATDSDNSSNLESIIGYALDTSVTVTFKRMYGLAYN